MYVNMLQNNCALSGAGKRKRRAADDEPAEDESLTLSTKLFVLPPGVQLPSSSEYNEDIASMIIPRHNMNVIINMSRKGNVTGLLNILF